MPMLIHALPQAAWPPSAIAPLPSQAPGWRRRSEPGPGSTARPSRRR